MEDPCAGWEMEERWFSKIWLRDCLEYCCFSRFNLYFWEKFNKVKMKLFLVNMTSLFPPIPRDPGATSRDDAIFSGERHFWCESLLQGLKSPWAIFLNKRVPEVVEIHPADWPEKHFSGQSTRRSSRVILSPSYTKWFSTLIDVVARPLQREDSREEFQKKKRFDKLFLLSLLLLLLCRPNVGTIS